MSGEDADLAFLRDLVEEEDELENELKLMENNQSQPNVTTASAEKDTSVTQASVSSKIDEKQEAKPSSSSSSSLSNVIMEKKTIGSAQKIEVKEETIKAAAPVLSKEFLLQSLGISTNLLASSANKSDDSINKKRRREQMQVNQNRQAILYPNIAADPFSSQQSGYNYDPDAPLQKTPVESPKSTEFRTSSPSNDGSSIGGAVNDDGDSSEHPQKKKKGVLRSAAGETWVDETLDEWTSPYRLFVGNLGNDVGDSILANTFKEYPSVDKVRVIRDKNTNKSKGYGFVSFKDGMEMLKAMREKQGEYCGAHPMKITRSKFEDRNVKKR